MDQRWKSYDIFFSRLSQGNDRLRFEIDEEFFKLFDCEEEFDQPKFDLFLDVEKASDLFIFHFDVQGTLGLICDFSLEPFIYSLNSQWRLVIEFGETFSDEDNGVLILPFRERKVNVAQYFYEMILLSLPKRRIHPDVENGNMNSEVLELLSRYGLEDTEEKNL